MKQRYRFAIFTSAAVLLMGLLRPAAAQQLPDFQRLDSLSQTLLDQGRYRALDSVGRAALRLGADYPALRRRLGAGALATDHPAAALRYYRQALRADPLDTTARYGLVLAYLRLGQREPAVLLGQHLAPGTCRALHLQSWRPVAGLEAEASGQTTTSTSRDNAGYARLGLGSRLGPRLSLEQNVSYFGQTVRLPDATTGTGKTYQSRQTEYHALLGAQLGPRWRVLLSYHYLGSRFGSEAYPGHLGYVALAYARSCYTVQAGYYTGRLTDTARTQADLRLTVYPLGNLRLYGFGRGSVIGSGGRSYPNALLGLGGRLRPWLSAEAFGNAGRVPVLAEADGRYVYNLLDPLRRRGGASVLILLPRSLAARLTFVADRRGQTLTTATYSVYSLTTTLSWTW